MPNPIMNTSSVPDYSWQVAPQQSLLPLDPDKHKCKPIIVLNLNCTFKVGLSYKGVNSF